MNQDAQSANISGAEQASAMSTEIQKFCTYLSEEEFEQGRQWAREAVAKLSTQHYEALDELETHRNFLLPDNLYNVNSALAFYMAAANYFSARFLIEQTYWYTHAFNLIDSAVRFLSVATSNSENKLLPTIRSLISQQTEVSNIELANYLSDSNLMMEAAERLLEQAGSIGAQADQLSAQDLEIFEKFIGPRNHSIQVFSKAVLDAASLFELRWRDWEGFERLSLTVLPKLEEARRILRSLSANILESELVTQIEVLRRFCEIATDSPNGELILESGAIEYAFFAQVEERVAASFDAALRTGLTNAELGNEGSILTALANELNAERLVDDPWSDIWAGQHARKLVDSVSWIMPSVRANIYGRDVEFNVKVRFYNFGLVAVTIDTKLSNISIGQARHFVSLGSPGALEEELIYSGNKQQIRALEEVADKLVFSKLAIILDQFGFGRDTGTGQAEAKLVNYDLILNRFTWLRVDSLQVRTDESTEDLNAAAAAAHPGFLGITVPNLEVRGAIDDWIMRAGPTAHNNLAVARYYNQGDYLFTDRHEATIALLNQAHWVRDQAIECITVNAAITNFFCISVASLNARIQGLLEKSSVLNSLENKSLVELATLRRDVEEKIRRLQSFERDVETMLDAMEAGRVMRFPDLTQLSDQIAQRMGLTGLSNDNRQLLLRAKATQEQYVTSIARAEENLKIRKAERLNRLASGIAVLASIVPLQEFLKLLNRTEFVSLSDLHIAGIMGLLLCATAALLFFRRS